jgi:hypothetical protein
LLAILGGGVYTKIRLARARYPGVCKTNRFV